MRSEAMRPILFVPLLAVTLVGACGRIGYDPLWEAGGGGAAGFAPGSGGSGTHSEATNAICMSQQLPPMSRRRAEL